MSPFDGTTHYGSSPEYEPIDTTGPTMGKIGSETIRQIIVLTRPKTSPEVTQHSTEFRTSPVYDEAKNVLRTVRVNYFGPEQEITENRTFYSEKVLNLKHVSGKLNKLSGDSEFVNGLTAIEQGELFAMTGLVANSYALNGQHPDRITALHSRLYAVKNLWYSTTKLYEAIAELPSGEERDNWLKKIGVVEYIRGEISEEIGLDPNIEPGYINPNWRKRPRIENAPAVSPYAPVKEVEDYMDGLIQNIPHVSEDSGMCFGDGKSIWTYDRSKTRYKIGPITNSELERFFLPTNGTEQRAD